MSKLLCDVPPLKESVCSKCGKFIRQRRIKLKSKIDTYRIWVHKETRRVECGSKEEIDKRHADEIKELFKPHRPDRHTERCSCPRCEEYRERTGV